MFATNRPGFITGANTLPLGPRRGTITGANAVPLGTRRPPAGPTYPLTLFPEFDDEYILVMEEIEPGEPPLTKGDRLPPGRCPNRRNGKNGGAVKSYPWIKGQEGLGTTEDPCVVWVIPPPESYTARDAYVNLAKEEARDWGFKCVVIRQIKHDWTHVRTKATFVSRRTRQTMIVTRKKRVSTDDHMTLYMGDSYDRLAVQGHMYLETMDDMEDLIKMSVYDRQFPTDQERREHMARHGDDSSEYWPMRQHCDWEMCPDSWCKNQCGQGWNNYMYQKSCETPHREDAGIEQYLGMYYVDGNPDNIVFRFHG